jgi:hypothetical protein
MKVSSKKQFVLTAFYCLLLTAHCLFGTVSQARRVNASGGQPRPVMLAAANP